MLKTLLELKPRDVPASVALRNTAAVVLPLAAGLATDHLGIGLGVAVGALNTMFSDQPGPYRLRLRRMLFAALAAGVSAFAGYTLGGNDTLIAVAALLWGIGGGLLVALGPDAGRIGPTSAILLFVTGADPRTPADAIGPSLLFCAGGVLLMLFSIAAWPLQRYRPERVTLAQLCRQLAASARRREDSSQAPPVTQALTDVENLLHGAYRARGAAMEALRVVAEIVERIRLELLAIGGLDERIDNAEVRATLQRLREYSARVLEALATALEAGATPLSASGALEGFDAAFNALGQLTVPGALDAPTMTVVLAHARALGGQLRAALRNADFAGSLGEQRLEAHESRLPRDLRPGNPLAILRANLRMSSIAFRHAIRCGACLSLAIVGERLSGLSHGYWIPMTTAIVLKPDFAGTFSFGLLRVIGTLLGLALTTALVHFAFGDPWERVVLLAVFCYGFRQLTTVHYALGVMLLTSLIVVLLSFEGIAPGETMPARAVGTSIGSALALLVYVVWPTWESRRFRPALADMLDAYRRYFLALLDGTPRVRAEVRRTARSARTNTQASLDRLRNEPHRDRRELVIAESVFANANRFVRAAMALEAIRQHSGGIPARAEVNDFVACTDAHLLALADLLRHKTTALHLPEPPLRARQQALRAALKPALGDAEAGVQAAAWIDASDRMTDSIGTLVHVLRGGTA
jgi:uncharacterized membrane protein YccC